MGPVCSERGLSYLINNILSLSLSLTVPCSLTPGRSEAEQLHVRLAPSVPFSLWFLGCLASRQMGRGILGDRAPVFCPSPRAGLRATWGPGWHDAELGVCRGGKTCGRVSDLVTGGPAALLGARMFFCSN